MEDLIILGIDTSGEYCSAGLVRGEQTLSETSKHGPQDHSRLLIPFIDRLLKKNSLKARDIGAIAVSIGPGSFTGLRVGVATAKALAQELAIPIVGIPTLDAIALNTVVSGQWLVVSENQDCAICVITDARRQQVYAAAYSSKLEAQSSKLKKIMKDTVLSIEDLLGLLTTNHFSLLTVFVGNAIKIYRDRIKEQLGEKAVFAPEELWRPKAETIALEGFKKLQDNIKGNNLFRLQPVYLRGPDIRLKTV